MNTVVYNKDNPFLAKLSSRRCLNEPQGNKQTYHFELDISQSGLAYQCGDSVGIYAKNDPKTVNTILQHWNWDGATQVILPKQAQAMTLEEALLSHCSLTGPTTTFLHWMLAHLVDPTEKAYIETLLIPENSEKLKAYLLERQMVDFAEEFKSLQARPQDYVNQLKKLQPRLYSIASSPLVHPDSVHLTIDIVSFISNGKKRQGIASSFLAHRVEINEMSIPLFLAPSHFKLPEDIDSPLIMVGPGTGVAPFRGFMQERVAKKSKGKAWLFFGAQQAKTDYLYQQEWEWYQKNGYLENISLAFSRDQAHKVYVQDKMKESAAILWQWLEEGAYFYVCGDAKAMAKDVDKALHTIIQEQGKMDELAAKEYVKNLKKLARYQRDVY